MEILFIRHKHSNMQRDTPALFSTVCPQLISLGLHSTGASNTDSSNDSARNTVYSSAAPAHLFVAQNRWRNWLKNKGKQINFWDAWLHMSDTDPSKGDSTDMWNTVFWMNNHDTQGLLGQEKNRVIAFLRQLQVLSKNGERIRKGLWMDPIQSRSIYSFASPISVIVLEESQRVFLSTCSPPDHRRWTLLLVTSLLNSAATSVSSAQRERVSRMCADTSCLPGQSSTIKRHLQEPKLPRGIHLRVSCHCSMIWGCIYKVTLRDFGVSF